MQDENDLSLNILPNIVRTLPNMVSFSKPRKRSTRLSYQGTSEMNSIKGSSLSSFDNNKAEINRSTDQSLNEEFWHRFKEYLEKTHREKSVVCRLSYAKKYYHVLINGDATDIQSTSNDKKLQIMKSLAMLSKFTVCYDKWKDVKDRYQLKWSNDNSVETFKKIINEDNSFDNY
jgi:hypothetical protein